MGFDSEHNNSNYHGPSRGVAGAGLGLGIAGTTLGAWNILRNGFFGGNFGCGNGWGNGYGYNNGCGYNNGNFGMEISEALAQRDAQIARLEAKAYSDESDLAIYKYFDGKLKAIDDKFHAMELKQCEINSTVNASIGVLGTQLKEAKAVLASITGTAVREDRVCNFDSCCGNG